MGSTWWNHRFNPIKCIKSRWWKLSKEKRSYGEYFWSSLKIYEKIWKVSLKIIYKSFPKSFQLKSIEQEKSDHLPYFSDSKQIIKHLLLCIDLPKSNEHEMLLTKKNILKIIWTLRGREIFKEFCKKKSFWSFLLKCQDFLYWSYWFGS